MADLSTPPWKNKLEDQSWRKWFRDLYAQLKPQINKSTTFTPILTNITLNGDASVSAYFYRLRGVLTLNIRFSSNSGSITFGSSATITNLPGSFNQQFCESIYKESGTTGTVVGVAQIVDDTIQIPNLGSTLTGNWTLNLTSTVNENDPINL